MQINNITSNLATVQSTGAGKIDIKLKKACQNFESLLVSNLLSQMRKTVSKSDLFGSGEKEEMFQGMLDNEIAGEVSKAGSIQIADILYKQLSNQGK